MPSPYERNLSNFKVSESFWRFMQTDPTDDRILIDGTGSLVTYLVVSGTLEAFYLKGDGSQITNLNLGGTNVYSSSQQVIATLVDQDLIVKTLTAQQYVVSSSVYYTTQSFSSGSTILGNSVDDVHQFTGSLRQNINWVSVLNQAKMALEAEGITVTLNSDYVTFSW